MPLDTLLEEKREIIREIAEKHGAVNIRAFGSRVRGDASSASDVDILIKLESGRDLLDLVAIKQDLEDLLGCSVDVVTEGGISPYMKDEIIASAVPL